jgi:hypothetical protein
MAESLIRLFDDSQSKGICRGCGATITWFDTLNDRKMPMNAGAVARKSEADMAVGRVVVYFSVADSHWATCDQRAQFKRRA